MSGEINLCYREDAKRVQNELITSLVAGRVRFVNIREIRVYILGFNIRVYVSNFRVSGMGGDIIL